MTPRVGNILFSGPMVRALLDGRKTQTRRLAWQREPESGPPSPSGKVLYSPGKESQWLNMHRRFEEVGHRELLYVRETWKGWECPSSGADHILCQVKEGNYLRQIPNTRDAADFIVGKFDNWHPSIHMPRWASRLTLEVTGTKLELLRDISEEDAEAEGVVFETADPPFFYVPYILPHSLTAAEIPEGAGVSFRKLWEHIHGKGAWAFNPEVVALSFRVHRCNVDEVRL